MTYRSPGHSALKSGPASPTYRLTTCPGTAASRSDARTCTATMAADPVFVDTNVLVYATRPSSTEHAAARAVLTRLEGEGSTLWVSPQVLREYLAAVTRPQATAPSLPLATAIAAVRDFRAA